jgi:hypothetical protein
MSAMAAFMPKLAVHKGFAGNPHLTPGGALTMFRPAQAVDSARTQRDFGG